MRRRSASIALAVALAVWSVPVVVSYASTNATPEIDHRIMTFTPTQCQAIFANIAKSNNPNARRAVADNAGKTCTAVMSVKGGPPKASMIASADTGCYGYWATWDFYTYLGVWMFRNHVNVGMCFEWGVRAYRNWGPDCMIDAVPGVGWGIDWCGVWHDNQAYPQAGDNYNVFPWINPWMKGFGWQRLYFSPWGYNGTDGCYQNVCALGSP